MSWRDMVGQPPGWRAALVYLGFYLTVLPLILHFFRDPRFQEMYPFYRYGNQYPLLGLVWELSYGSMFFSLEFFFRGFLIRQLSPRWGWGALWFSALPYCAIHYLKPLPEMLGALPAGLVLGYASWRSGSIWGGLAVHLGVAFTMDGLQLLNNAGAFQ
jgi:membrane protease YdiL (CAAX protease family)